MRFDFRMGMDKDSSNNRKNVTLAGFGERFLNRDRNNNNNGGNNRKPQQNGSKIRMGRFTRLGEFGESESQKPTESRKEKLAKNNINAQVEVDHALLDDFVENYTKNKVDSAYVSNLLVTQFIDVAKAMEHYYDGAYKNILDSMNNVIRLMTTKSFAINALNVIKNHEENFPNWEEARESIAFVVSLMLECYHTKMIEETKLMYVEIIEIIWGFEIKEISDQFHLTEDAVFDLVVGVPYFGRIMSDSAIRNSYQAMLNMLINHGGAAREYLNSENQRKLFYKLFPDVERVAIKAVGNCLCDELISFDEDEDEALYNEYVEMLYNILNEHDVEDIRFVLRFVVKTRSRMAAECKDTVTVFNTERAVTYDNIKKVLLDYIEHNDNAKKFLDA